MSTQDPNLDLQHVTDLDQSAVPSQSTTAEVAVAKPKKKYLTIALAAVGIIAILGIMQASRITELLRGNLLDAGNVGPGTAVLSVNGSNSEVLITACTEEDVEIRGEFALRTADNLPHNALVTIRTTSDGDSLEGFPQSFPITEELYSDGGYYTGGFSWDCTSEETNQYAGKKVALIADVVATPIVPDPEVIDGDGLPDPDLEEEGDDEGGPAIPEGAGENQIVGFGEIPEPEEGGEVSPPPATEEEGEDEDEEGSDEGDNEGDNEGDDEGGPAIPEGAGENQIVGFGEIPEPEEGGEVSPPPATEEEGEDEDEEGSDEGDNEGDNEGDDEGGPAIPEVELQLTNAFSGNVLDIDNSVLRQIAEAPRQSIEPQRFSSNTVVVIFAFDPIADQDPEITPPEPNNGVDQDPGSDPEDDIVPQRVDFEIIPLCETATLTVVPGKLLENSDDDGSFAPENLLNFGIVGCDQLKLPDGEAIRAHINFTPPEGLSIGEVVRQDDTKFAITIIGNAVNHDAVDTQDNLLFNLAWEVFPQSQRNAAFGDNAPPQLATTLLFGFAGGEQPVEEEEVEEEDNTIRRGGGRLLRSEDPDEEEEANRNNGGGGGALSRARLNEILEENRRLAALEGNQNDNSSVPNNSGSNGSGGAPVVPNSAPTSAPNPSSPNGQLDVTAPDKELPTDEEFQRLIEEAGEPERLRTTSTQETQEMLSESPQVQGDTGPGLLLYPIVAFGGTALARRRQQR